MYYLMNDDDISLILSVSRTVGIPSAGPDITGIAYGL